MATNTIVLIAAVAVAALLMAGMLAGVEYKMRTQARRFEGETIRDQAEDARHVSMTGTSTGTDDATAVIPH